MKDFIFLAIFFLIMASWFFTSNTLLQLGILCGGVCGGLLIDHLIDRNS